MSRAAVASGDGHRRFARGPGGRAAHPARPFPSALAGGPGAEPRRGAPVGARGAGGGRRVLALPPAAPPLASRAGDVAWMSAHVLWRSGQLASLVPALDVRLPGP